MGIPFSIVEKKHWFDYITDVTLHSEEIRKINLDVFQ